MLSHQETLGISAYLAAKPHAEVSYPFEKTLAVYSLEGTPFAYLDKGRQLLRLSLRTDKQLSKVLRERYEEVSLGQKLDKRYWITIVVSGQLGFNELTALIDHSYQQAEALNNSSD